MLAQKKPVFGKVVAVVKKFSADEQARMEYDKHELWRMDYSATMKNAARKGHAQGHARGLEEGRAEGKSEGIAEGEIKGKMAAARNMKAMGLPMATIAQATGLSAKEIARLD